MRLYHRSKYADMMNTIRICYFDADHGRVKLALDRLYDLEGEIGVDAKISYAEAIIRKDFLGQGAKATELFQRAYLLDNHHSLAACNAAYLARNEEEFREWVNIATELSPQDIEPFHSRLRQLDEGVRYWQHLVADTVSEGQSGHYGESAAYAELALLTAQMRPDEEAEFRQSRAVALRALDQRAEDIRKSIPENFPPEERLALIEAVAELERALKLDPYSPESWNTKSAWCYLSSQYEESLRCADQAIELRPVNYPEPHRNKALAFWYSKRDAEALVSAQKALEQAQAQVALQPGAIDAVNDLTQAREIVQVVSTPRPNPSLNDLEPILHSIWKNAQAISAKEIAYIEAASIENISRYFHRLAAPLAGRRCIEYVSVMGELVSHFSPETGFCVINNVGQFDQRLWIGCNTAIMYIACFGEPIMQRDAARILLLTMFAAESGSIIRGDISQIRQIYRTWVLEPSAAAQDEMRNIRSVVRAELERVSPLLVELIDEQQPVNSEDCEKARRTVLAELSRIPLVGDAASQLVICPHCQGSGAVPLPVDLMPNSTRPYYPTLREKCGLCGGTGQITQEMGRKLRPLGCLSQLISLATFFVIPCLGIGGMFYFGGSINRPINGLIGFALGVLPGILLLCVLFVLDRRYRAKNFPGHEF